MSPPTWVFDPLPPSGAIVGGTAANYVFAPTLDIFVREVLQNAHDQRRRVPGRARVEIDVVDLDGAARRRTLDAMRFDELRAHLEGTAAQSYKLGSQVRDALERLDDDGEPLRIVRITDYDTAGLTGGEDEKGTNFNSLCRDVLVNTDVSAGKGGSYGLGKAVLWRFSALSTVLFTSTVPSDDAQGASSDLRLRAFGRTDLANHETVDGGWAGPGWLGAAETLPAGRRAVSMWDDDAAALADALGGHGRGGSRSGTTVAVVGFAEPGSPVTRPARQLADDLATSAARWFWPAMSASPPTLTVAVRVVRDDTVTEVIEVDPAGPFTAPLVQTARAPATADHAVEHGSVAERALPVTVPGRRDRAHNELTATATLRVRRCGVDEAEADGVNRVALVRGSGMVVELRRPRRAPTDGGAFHAVLLAGLATGGSSVDEQVEAFLRAAEPPAHNRWVHDTDMVRNGYLAGARKALDGLWRAIDDALVDVADPATPAREPGPPALAKLFAVGSSGDPGGAAHGFDIRATDSSLTEGVWTIEVLARRFQRRSPWRVDVSVWLDAESGRGTPLALAAVEADTVIEVQRLAPHQMLVDLGAADDVARLRLSVPVNGRSVDASMSRLRVDLRPTVRRAASS